jgi:hypothetical protein
MKPGRPFGLSLAIIASVMLFTLIPLMQVSMVLLVQYRLQSTTLSIGSDSGEVQPIAVGGDFTGVSDSALFVQTLLGLAFLMIAVFAWRGRPSFIRSVFVAAVGGLTLLTLVASALPLLAQPDLQSGFDSGAGISHSLLSTRIVFSLLVPLYVVWYSNRAPARAFFLGYDLAESTTEANAAK